MTVQSKIRRKPVAVRPSRIRREPVRKLTEAELQAIADAKRDRELWSGVAGVVLYGAIIAVLAIGIGVATLLYYSPAAAAKEGRFRQCYNGGINCVLDGDTIYFDRQKVEIAGIEAPLSRGAQCPFEKDRGIDAAVRLAALLNSGEVTVSKPFRDGYGRVVSTVMVNGKDAGSQMISAGLGRRYFGQKKDWCVAAAESNGSGE